MNSLVGLMPEVFLVFFSFLQANIIIGLLQTIPSRSFPINYSFMERLTVFLSEQLVPEI